MELLANAVWHALTGPQASVARGTGTARCFDPSLSVFAALPDHPTEGSWQALAELVGPDEPALLLREEIDPPPGWTERFGGVGVQMVHRAPDRARDRSTDPPFDVHRLGDADVPEMVDLVARTEPGPFAPRTIELGTYLGVRDPETGALVAMAGQRLRPPGHVEISAVCTDPRFRGRGLARLLVGRLVEEIGADGDTPMLHAASSNTGAIGLYERMGFETVRELRFAAFQAPGEGVADRPDQAGPTG